MKGDEANAPQKVRHAPPQPCCQDPHDRGRIRGLCCPPCALRNQPVRVYPQSHSGWKEIGTLNGIFGSAAFVLGSLLAGIYVSKFGLKKTLFTLCCIFNLPFVAYTFLAVVQPTDVYLIGTCITMEYFGYGFGFVGLTLFMMQQIAPGKHQMSHYAFASGIMNLGVMLPGMVSGYFSDLLGYRNFFIYVLIATIPAFLITYFIPFTYDDSKK